LIVTSEPEVAEILHVDDLLEVPFHVGSEVALEEVIDLDVLVAP